MKTKSELLFEQYCTSVGYKWYPIPMGSGRGRTPDGYVQAGNYWIVVEIKELSPSDDDKRRATQLSKQGWTSGVTEPGKRVFKEIQRGAKQLKKYAHCGLPCVLVLYDNIVVDGIRPRAVSQLLEPSLLDFGIYGLQTVILSVSCPNDRGDDVRVIANGRGGKRQMTADSRAYISAVSVLCKDQDGGEPYLHSYHNFFANAPLPRHLFRGPKDRHFTKPDYPNKCPQVWDKI